MMTMATDVAILCQVCFGNGSWDSMWPDGGCGHIHDWAVAEVGEGDEEWEVTWLATGMTLAEAQEYNAAPPR